MTEREDIAERLRRYGSPRNPSRVKDPVLAREAADEIERLRALTAPPVPEWTLRDEIEASERRLSRFCDMAWNGQAPADAREFSRQIDSGFRSIKAHPEFAQLPESPRETEPPEPPQ